MLDGDDKDDNGGGKDEKLLAPDIKLMMMMMIAHIHTHTHRETRYTQKR